MDVEGLPASFWADFGLLLLHSWAAGLAQRYCDPGVTLAVVKSARYRNQGAGFWAGQFIIPSSCLAVKTPYVPPSFTQASTHWATDRCPGPPEQ